MNDSGEAGEPRSPETALERGFEQVLSPFEQFVRAQATSSLLLILCTAAAIYLVGSSYAHAYQSLLHVPLGLKIGQWQFELSLRHWINDALMASFFFLLGLETKKELLAGELRDIKRATAVGLAALGGMIVPALIFAMFNIGQPTSAGWAIPVATDAAFALGALGLLGSRVPAGVVTFLAAFAIMDDIGAVSIIAIFLTDQVNLERLGFAALIFAGLMACNAVGIRRPLPYVLGGVGLWIAIYGAGVHGTVGGMLTALAVPARPKVHPQVFLPRARRRMAQLAAAQDNASGDILGEPKQHELISEVAQAAREATTPLQRWEARLDVPVSLLVVPLFALANAGVVISLSGWLAMWTSPMGLGIVFGLVLGKAIGISSMCWLGLKLGIGALPKGVTMPHVLGLSVLAGMGFTMALFVANLSYESGQMLETAKLAIFTGSLIAALGGLSILWFATDAKAGNENRSSSAH